MLPLRCAEIAEEILKTKRPCKLVTQLEKALNVKIGIVTVNEDSDQPNYDAGKLPIICRACTDEGVEGLARAFFATPPSITLCSNRLYRRSDIQESLVHEMIHAYDYLVREMDLTKCKRLACSEIRANREGECSGRWIELFDSARKTCTKNSAIHATQSIFPKKGRECVKVMFDECYADREPT